ncbi:MAG TPA: CHAT domain-containing protein, partial [Leptolyngbyaceae cyanobacterium]
MNKLVVLSLGNGNLHNGFPTVTAQVWEQSDRPIKFTGYLPAAPEISELYRYWQLLYSALYQRLDLNPRIEVDDGDVTNVSSVEFSHLCQRLSNEINIWLNSESFRHIEQQLRTYLHSYEEIRFIIETSDNLLKRLPWHLWQFFEDYPKAEVALSATEYQTPKQIPKKHRSKLKVLAIFGNSKGIDLRKDRIFLKQLSNKAQLEFLVEPGLEILNDQLWQEWDILFFAGHSYSKEQGIIQLNQTDAIALDSLKYALKKAISKGLKLAIFNSCDGLGLAQALLDLHIPQVILMREPVPDVVAQEFLK